ncbi:MAG: hypothetical protein R2912_09460 [Eubacteriales bacterium]
MNLKQRLRAGEHLLGTMVTTFAAADMAKLIRQYGFDFFIIDCEHGVYHARGCGYDRVARAIDMPVMAAHPLKCGANTR